MSMRLQVNLKGSWRDVLNFPADHEEAIRASASRLACIAGDQVKFRVADDQNIAVAYLEAPFLSWRTAPWRKTAIT